MNERPAIVILALLALSGCDGVPGLSKTDCFEVIAGNSTQPFSSILINKCSGETWLLVKNQMTNKPEDGFTYQWMKMERFEFNHPVLVNGK